MMIIDFHAHWWPSDRFVQSRQAWKTFIRGVNKRNYKTADIELKDEELEEFFFDPDGAKLLRQMNTAGVDMTVLLPLDWDKVNGAAERNIIEQNEAYSQLSKQYPDKFISFFSIDPERKDATPLFSTAVKEWGMRGLKLYPPTGFFPDDQCCSSLYEICLDYGLPVVFHGTTSVLSAISYCHPEGFRRLAKKYPALKIVIAHAGGLEWHTDAVQACLDYDHVYLDISGFQGILDPVVFKFALENMYSNLKSFEKVLFGTDNPMFNRMCPIKDMIANLKDLNIPEHEKANLLGNTGKNLLGLS